jgi:hypothetical protein
MHTRKAFCQAGFGGVSCFIIYDELVISGVVKTGKFYFNFLFTLDLEVRRLTVLHVVIFSHGTNQQYGNVAAYVV